VRIERLRSMASMATLWVCMYGVIFGGRRWGLVGAMLGGAIGLASTVFVVWVVGVILIAAFYVARGGRPTYGGDDLTRRFINDALLLVMVGAIVGIILELTGRT
jgi:hypothetical protein